MHGYLRRAESLPASRAVVTGYVHQGTPFSTHLMLFKLDMINVVTARQQSIRVCVCMCFKMFTLQHSVSRLMNFMYSKTKLPVILLFSIV